MATQEQIAELKQKMREQRETLLAALGSLSEADAERSSTGEGEWSAKQQMAHLCEMETAYRAWVEEALAEDNPNVDGVYGERPAIRLEDAHNHTVAEHTAEMRRQRTTTEAMIDGMAPGEFDRTATQQMFGTLTVLQWLRSYYRHDRMHLDQVQGRDPEYKPRFTGAEPDQRRG
ncbi:MAG TPA: DinB family protein [Dehalococcoidia bacterium]|nr:DinB family protein [Dehalococcoidia bacterium]